MKPGNLTPSCRKLWADAGYEIPWTQDGSPSLCPKTTDPEWMHHSGGAASETRYIYGEALKAIYQIQSSAQILSIGLGLGYNEILSSYFSLKSSNDLKILSYEADPFLRQQFRQFLAGNSSLHEHVVFHLLAEEEEFEAESAAISQKIREHLLQALRSHEFQMRSAFTPESFKNLDQNDRQNLIFFDAYSAKTSPELWQESLLDEMLTTMANESCLVSSYACTGNLNRSLKRNGFQVHRRRGFSGKRDCCFATRGLTLNLDSIPGIF